MEATLVPIALFAIAPLIVWAVCAYRYKTKHSVLQLLEVMTQKGDTITPATIHALGIRPRSRHADLRTGIILIALALAFFGLGAVIPGGETAGRAVVLLCLLHGLTQAEAAQATGLPLGTVKSHITRGKAKLRAVLSDYAPAQNSDRNRA